VTNVQYAFMVAFRRFCLFINILVNVDDDDDDKLDQKDEGNCG
jgi:hypothetical protein